MRSAVVLGAVLLVGVALAGCAGGTDDAEGEESPVVVDRDSFRLDAGRGAIAGLLVDDRFRPIHLTDSPQGEFQTTGFVLLQEAGQQVKTNANGEFSFVNLAPGQYTLRVTAAGHEATPQRVSVEEGVFNELSVIERRTASVGSLILTEEFSGFVPCAMASPVVAGTVGCVIDGSGDSFRPGPSIDFTVYGEALHFLVIEGTANQRGSYDLIFRENDGSSLGGREYGRMRNADLDAPYARLVIANSQAVEDWEGRSFPNDWAPMNTLMFYWGEGGPVNVGFRFAIQFNYMISIFLGDPAVDLETYCLVC